ncbi:MAG: DinB family protein [Cyclobacteriaceae bacterium]
MSSRKKIQELVGQFTKVYSESPWYGDSILGIINRVTDDAAFWQPNKNAHSIAQIVWHMIYWRQALIKRLEGDSVYKPSMKSEDNWSNDGKLKTTSWKNIKELLTESQEKLTTLLDKQDDSLLDKAYTEKATYEELITGIFQHDLYHLGQIAYLKSIHSSK